MPDTLLLTGLPRAGTTLCCHILNRHANLLALHEPLKPGDFNPVAGKATAIAQIADFARQSRVRALAQGLAVTQQKGGRVPDDPVAIEAASNGLRPLDVSLADIDVRAQVQDERFTLVIKHNALFAALLPELAGAFPVFGIVRNPLAVLASWSRVDLPVNRGRIPAGELFDPALKARLDQLPDVLDRQMWILEWFCRRYADHLGARILRYEEFVARPESVGECLQLGSPCPPEENVRTSRNAGYDLALMERLYRPLNGFGEAIWQFYSRHQVEELMDSIRAAT